MRRHVPVTAHCTNSEDFPKSAILLQHGHFDPKFQVEEVAPPIIFAQTVRPMNALQLCCWQIFRIGTVHYDVEACDACADMGQL